MTDLEVIEVDIGEEAYNKIVAALGTDDEERIADFVKDAALKEAAYVLGLEDLYQSEHNETNGGGTKEIHSS